MSEIQSSLGAGSASGRESRSIGRARAAQFVVGAVTGLSVLAVGLVGGYVSGRQSSAPGAGGHAGGAPEGGDAHAAHGGAPGLSPQTLANLGVEIGELKATDFVRSQEVAAIVAEPRGARRSAHAPVAGVVRHVLVRPGSTIAAGDALAEIIRDPFPRPVLTLTDSLLRGLDEDFHATVSELRTTSLALELARAELERVRKVINASGVSGLLPTRTEIDLHREVQRAERSLQNAREESRRHGLTVEEVAAIEAGTLLVPPAPDVHRALEARRLWGPAAERVFAALSEASRAAPFVVALVGELSAANLLSPELEDALRRRPTIAASFIDVAGLLQAGETVQSVLAIDDVGGFSPIVVVRAPADAPDWDVISLDVVSGAHVARGGDVASLLAPHRMILRLAHTGPDVAPIERALRTGEELVAEPLQPGAGPGLTGLRLTRFDPPTEAGGASFAVAEFPNAPLYVGPGNERIVPRSWQFRDGARYRVRVPLERLSGRFVLPAEAVISRGADQVLVIQQGRGWKQIPVHVEYLDARVAVVSSSGGGIFAGDRVVVRGAYALSLALQAAAGGGVDPHAGHNH
ncbi:MAG: hypothetical protein JNM10_06285 [Planctomycetia bacterium]|nr:hypothetical protein [Planctomycetia bacterium]